MPVIAIADHLRRRRSRRGRRPSSWRWFVVEIAPAAARISGQLAILACPPPLCPHVEFAVAAAVGVPVRLEWTPQPARPGTVCAALEWRGGRGTAGRLASRLAGIGALYFDVVESASPGCDAERYSGTPDLGLHRAALAANGDVVVSEDRIRELLAEHSGPAGAPGLPSALRDALGTAWDEVLEPLRSGGSDGPVTYLRRTG
jgi:hypothetical protein